MTGTKVEAIHHHGVAVGRDFVVGRVLERASSTPTPTACGSARSTSARTARPGDDRVRRAERRRRADGRRRAPGRGDAGRHASSKRAKLRGVVSEGMILAENELEIGARRRRASWCSTS